MYTALGVEWANTTLAIVSVVLVPIPIVLMKLGPKFRTMGKFAVKSDGRGHADAEMVERDDAFAVTVEAGQVKAPC